MIIRPEALVTLPELDDQCATECRCRDPVACVLTSQ